MVFIGDVVGDINSAEGVNCSKVKRLTPSFNSELIHVANKSELTATNFKTMCFSSFSARPDLTDLAYFLADSRVPFLVGQSLEMYENAPRNKMLYFEFDNFKHDEMEASQDSAIYSDYDTSVAAPFRYNFKN